MRFVTITGADDLVDVRDLFVDTETTGLPVADVPLDDPRQPHLAEIGLVLTRCDGVEVGCYAALVRPVGWEMPADAGGVNGLTTDYLAAYGLPLAEVWDVFTMFACRATLIVAHNVAFDRTILDIVASRTRCDAVWTRGRQWYCTKEAAAPLLQLPLPPGGNRYPPAAAAARWKWPSLTEAHELLVGTERVSAHRALADARACRDVYFAIRERETAGVGQPARD